jgi:hypothetical protein
MPGLKWYAIYSDQPVTTIEVAEPGDVLARFDIATMLGRIARRKVSAMWLINGATHGAEVIRVYGLVLGCRWARLGKRAHLQEKDY